MATEIVGEPRWMLGHRVTLLHTIGDFSLLEVVSDPGVPGPPPHHHDHCSEFFYICEGELEVSVDGATRRLGRGQSFSIPPGAVHTFMNRGAAPVRFVTGFSPKGFERMFIELGLPVDQPGAREASVSPEMIGRVVRGAAGWGMHMAPR